MRSCPRPAQHPAARPNHTTQCKQLLSTAASSPVASGAPKVKQLYAQIWQLLSQKEKPPSSSSSLCANCHTSLFQARAGEASRERHQPKKTAGCYRFEFPLSSAPTRASWTHFVGDLGTSPLYQGVNKQQFGQKTRKIGGEGDLHSANLSVFQRGEGLGGYFTLFFFSPRSLLYITTQMTSDFLPPRFLLYLPGARTALLSQQSLSQAHTAGTIDDHGFCL